MNESSLPARPSLVLDVGPFVVGGLLLWVGTRVLLPSLVRSGVAPGSAWRLAASLLVFLPVAAMGAALLQAEGRGWRLGRLWLRRPSGRDWGLAGLGALVTFTAGGCLALVQTWLGGELAPAYLRPQPGAGSAGPGWGAASGLAFFLLNITAEELTWRAVLLPRHEARWGQRAWLVNGALWAAFHLAMGPGVVLVAAPALLIVPAVVQRTHNAWTGVAIHGLYNAAPSLLLAVGLLP